LLRGLLAYSAGDDGRAAENFARLDPKRLPCRLAGPFRASVDPAWRATLPVEKAGSLLKQHERLNGSPVVEPLREIARHRGREKPLVPVFRIVEALAPKWKQQTPDVYRRLANCLYHAILRQGQPDDLNRYRKVFGDPPDDPGFAKLQAQINEQLENFG